MSETKIYRHNQPFPLENGSVLLGLEVAYHTYGVRAPDDSNVVWVCHALTANSDVLDWWAGLFGPGSLFDPERYFIVCANNLGSCYGTTGPLSLNPQQGAPYYHEFPDITIRDMVQIHESLRRHLGIRRINVLIGGSQGGQQALEWAIQQPDLAENLALIATNAAHSPWGIAFNESQRLAIATDPTWKEHSADAGIQGMKTARSIALLSYRHYQTYRQGQQPATNELLDHYPAASYQRYQGEKLAKRFNAFSYWALSKAMDTHNVGRGRHSVVDALGAVKARALIVSVSSDLLFPPEEQRFLAKHIPQAIWQEIDSLYGHDGFLTETGALSTILETFLQNRALKEVKPKSMPASLPATAIGSGLKNRIW